MKNNILNKDNLILLLLVTTTIISWITGILLISVLVFAVVAILNAFIFRNRIYFLAIFLLLLPSLKNIRIDRDWDLIGKSKLIQLGFLSIVFFSSMIITSLKQKKFDFNSYLTLPILLVLLSYILSLIFSIYPMGTFIGILGHILFILFYFFMRATLDGEKQEVILFSKIFIAFALVCTFQIYYVIAQSESFIETITGKKINVEWANINNLAQYLLFAVPLSIFMAFKSENKILYTILSALFAATILVTNSRAAYVGLLVMVLLLFAFAIKAKEKMIFKTKKIILALTIIAVTILILGKIGVLSAVYERNFANRDFLADSGRFNLYRSGIERFKESPIFGRGAFVLKKLIGNMSSHNWIVDVLATTGIFGLIAFLFLNFRKIKMLWFKKTVFSTMFLILIVSLLITNIFDIGYINYIYLIPLFIGVAVAEKEKVEAKDNIIK